jgi:hypothetical protein
LLTEDYISIMMTKKTPDLTQPQKRYRASAMFKKAADLGDKRAAERLHGNVAGPIAPGSVVQRDGYSGDTGGVDMPRAKDKECVIM